MRTIVKAVILAVIAVALSVVAAAQSTTSLRGVITDAKGALLPGATVKLSDPKTGFDRSVMSGNDGAYQFLQVPPATYTLEVTAAGFAGSKRENLTLQVNTPATINIALQVQGAREQVEVTSEAPLVNTQDASIGNAFTERQLLRLPSEGRDPASILSLQPGVTFVGGKNIDQSNDSRGGSVSGARSDQTNITLDGLDDNDQLNGIAFQGALRSTLDSLQEFRVTTTNGNSDEGRSSGAQVVLVTKSGSNAIHGTFYNYNRTSLGEANDWFNKAAEIRENLPNKPGQLIRNTFGATFGGPIQKDRLFYFLAYEGQRKRETIQTTRVVPSTQLRNGIMQYPCIPSAAVNGDPNCVLGTPNANGFNVVSNPGVSQTDYIVQLSQAQFAAMDPIAASNGVCPWADSNGNCGVDPNVLPVFQQYPQPNTDTVGDLLDYRGFTFPGSDPVKLNTYIVRLDYKITSNGNHNLFLRGNLQNDSEATPPQFPGQPSYSYNTGNNKAIAAGYTALLRPTLINNFRWSLIRQGSGMAGLNSQPFVDFRGLDDVTALASQSEFTNLPVQNFVDDLTWTKGKHTLQFGTNLRLVHNNRRGNLQNVSYYRTDPYQLDNAAIAGASSFGFCNGVQPDGNPQCSLDPDGFSYLGYPGVDSSFGENYDFATVGLAGIVSTANPVFNQDKNANQFAPGALIPRHFKSWEAEWYVQDSWRVKPSLTVTAGLRYSLLQPPYETAGNQAAPTVSIDSIFEQRAKTQLLGQAYSPGGNLAQGLPGGVPPVQFGISGQANGKQPYWNWDYKDFAPRLAVAYSPTADSGWRRTLFGGAGKSSIRLGYGLYFDHFGQGIVNTFDRSGSFGLTTFETNPAGVQDVDCSARFTGTFSLPEGTFCGQAINGAPPGPFPVTAPLGPNVAGGFNITWGIDDKLHTPYSHVFNFSFTRDLGHSYAIEASYVGRLGRHLLQETDLGMPQDIVDPASHMDYFTAATQLTKQVNAGGAITPIPYFEDLFSSLIGVGGYASATASIASQIWIPENEIVSLQYLDTACFPACSQLPGQSAPTQYNFFMPQFSSLWGFRTSGNSSYNAMNLTLRRVVSNGLQFDINYTYSKSIDVGSNAERINLFNTPTPTAVGGFASQVINSWSPDQLRAVSDFDTTHQINSNWVYDLPVGHGKHFGGNMGGVANAILGGWSLSGLLHWSSGLPFSIFPGQGWSTNYDLQGEAIEIGNPGKVGVHINAQGNPTMFADSATAIAAFRHPYPGESGQRNELRGPGFFGIDAGLAKDWKIKEEQTLSFSWEAFNVTNAVRFDAASSANDFDLTTGTNFGVYGNTLTQPRVMQFMLRYSF
jgi:hypothetical protein